MALIALFAGASGLRANSSALDTIGNNLANINTTAFKAEFTCVCPLTGQPDFGEIRIRYVPDRFCVELKSLKLYLWAFRNEGHFHEAVTNQILDDLVAALDPKKMTVIGDFKVRGGIHTVVTATHQKSP